MITDPQIAFALCAGAAPLAYTLGRKLRRRRDGQLRHHAEEHERLTGWLPDLTLRPQLAIAGASPVGRHRRVAQGLTNRHHRG